MRKSVIFILFLMVFSIANGQVLFRYPKGQKSYNGDFYKDFHQILKEDNIEPCENKKELYNVRVLVNEDASISIIRDSDDGRMQHNKCTIEILKKVLPKMKGWTPAQVDGEKVKAATPIIVYLDDIFNYKDGYNPDKYIQESDFITDISAFRKKVMNYVYNNIEGKYDGIGRVEITIAFEFGEEGKIIRAFTVESSGNEGFDRELENAIMRMKDKKWKPNYYRDIPVKTYYVFPFIVSF